MHSVMAMQGTIGLTRTLVVPHRNRGQLVDDGEASKRQHSAHGIALWHSGH
jgi:hypothetical protein